MIEMMTATGPAAPHLAITVKPGGSFVFDPGNLKPVIRGYNSSGVEVATTMTSDANGVYTIGTTALQTITKLSFWLYPNPPLVSKNSFIIQTSLITSILSWDNFPLANLQLSSVGINNTFIRCPGSLPKKMTNLTGLFSRCVSFTGDRKSVV